MSNVPNVNSSSNTQYSPNPDTNVQMPKGASAFLYLAEAMSGSLDSAKKSFDSQSLEQKEKQTILQELQGINDLARRKALLEFLIKTFGSSDSSIKAWLTGLEEHVQSSIDLIGKFWKDYEKEEKALQKDDKREKKYHGTSGAAVFYGDGEWDSKLQKQRLQLLKNIKDILQNPDEALSNIGQLSSDFKGLQTIVNKENKETQKLSGPANWWEKHVTSKLDKTIKGICHGEFKKIVDIALPGAALVDGLMYAVQGILSVPASVYGGPQKTILNDTSSFAQKGQLELQAASTANSVMKGQYAIDSNTVSMRIQKGAKAQANYNSLIENTLVGDTKLISSINYSNKV
ncbi:MAG: hypothetical protein K940chlam5_00142 [Candidatus Anoxychlamydiales bacterium]|nr:hypothetical protein [Candidatus Anoxychlamydiales bacterium]